jgi:hypothetical protein
VTIEASVDHWRTSRWDCLYRWWDNQEPAQIAKAQWIFGVGEAINKPPTGHVMCGGVWKLVWGVDTPF